jgi:hypothetical protein
VVDIAFTFLQVQVLLQFLMQVQQDLLSILWLPVVQVVEMEILVEELVVVEVPVDIELVLIFL